MATFQYRATPNTLTEGDLQGGLLDSKGNIKVVLASGATAAGLTTPADASAGVAGLWVVSQNELYDRTSATWNKQRGNEDNISLVPSAAYTSTQTSADQTNYNARGVIVVLDATAVTAVGSFTLAIQGKDPVSGKYFSLLTGAAVSTVTTNVYTVYPGNTVAANVSVSTVLPRTWRIVATYNSGTNLTFSVGASLIV